MQTKQERLEQYVARGAAWLDENRPGWEFKIDLGELNLMLPDCCVLGQVDGNFWDSLRRQAEFNRDTPFFDETGWAASHGFFIRDGNETRRISEYNQLTDAWRTLIKDRFDRGVFSDLGGLILSSKQGD